MKRTFFLVLSVLAVLVFMISALLRSTPNTNTPQQPDTRAPSSTDTLEIEGDLSRSSEYGSLTNTYVDVGHGFSLHYPASFLGGNFPGWDSIVDNETKAHIWMGFCSPDCIHLIRFPFSGSDQNYTQDSEITSEESPDIPFGEGRRIHILSNREFITEHGTQAIEQFYETTGFQVATGESITLYCAEDTPCEKVGPSLRYIFFSEGKAPYAMSVSPLPSNENLSVFRAMVNTVSY